MPLAQAVQVIAAVYPFFSSGGDAAGNGE